MGPAPIARLSLAAYRQVAKACVQCGRGRWTWASPLIAGAFVW